MGCGLCQKDNHLLDIGIGSVFYFDFVRSMPFVF